MADKSPTDPRVDRVTKCYDLSQKAFQQTIIDSEEAFRYINNDSWSSTDKNNAVNAKKPALKYNILMPVINALKGNEQLARRRAIFKPRNLESIPVAEIVQGRWNALNDEQSIEEKLQQAFEDGLIMQKGGWIQRSFKVNEKGYLDYCYEVINAMRVYPDPELLTSDYNLKKINWLVKESWMTLDSIIDKYEVSEDEFKEEKKVQWWNNVGEFFKRFTDSDFSGNPNVNRENNTYKVLEMQEKKIRKVYRIYDNVNDIYFNLTPKQFKEAKAPNFIKVRETSEERIHFTTIVPFFSNVVVLDEDDKATVSNFDLFPFFSFQFNAQANEAESLIGNLEDAQDDLNKHKSQLRDYLTQMTADNRVVHGKEAELVEAMRRLGNQPGQVFNARNPSTKITRLGPDAIAPEIFINAGNSIELVDKMSAITPGVKGEEGKSGESNVLRQSKVERAAAVINPYFKGLSMLRKAIAEDYVDNFGFVHSELDRVIETKSAKGVFSEEIVNLVYGGEILNNVENASLHVELDEGEDNLTNKETNFETGLALWQLIAQVNPQLANALVGTLVESAPIPIAGKMMEVINDIIAKQGQEAEEMAELQKTREVLKNVEAERGMVVESQKIQLEQERLQKESQNKQAQN